MGAELRSEPAIGPTTLAIGINADSLAGWFFAAVKPLLLNAEWLFDLRIDDQEQTHRYLREGEVVGCISTEATAMQGCRVELLGMMPYRLLATPAFAGRWFPDGLSLAAAELAPAVLFNHKDRLQQHFFAQALGDYPRRWSDNYIPAPEQFLQAIIDGYAYGMVPDWQSAGLRQTGELIELVPDCNFAVELYWYCWNLASSPLKKFFRQLVATAQRMLAL